MPSKRAFIHFPPLELLLFYSLFCLCLRKTTGEERKDEDGRGEKKMEEREGGGER
jgi:hypothetical protein